MPTISFVHLSPEIKAGGTW